MKTVIWMGSSRDELKQLPAAAQKALGFELYRVQCGYDPMDWKPMVSVGAGVREIRARDRVGTFRMIYLAIRPEGIFVLHCFQKKKPQTSRSDLELAKKRFKAIERVKP